MVIVRGRDYHYFICTRWNIAYFQNVKPASLVKHKQRNNNNINRTSSSRRRRPANQKKSLNRSNKIYVIPVASIRKNIRKSSRFSSYPTSASTLLNRRNSPCDLKMNEKASACRTNERDNKKMFTFIISFYYFVS